MFKLFNPTGKPFLFNVLCNYLSNFVLKLVLKYIP